jgi:hypothetical protein
MVTGEVPWNNLRPSQVITNVFVHKKRLAIPLHTDNDLKKIMEQCWQTDPNKRPSFKELLSLFQTSEQSPKTAHHSSISQPKDEWDSFKLELLCQVHFICMIFNIH